MSNQELILAKMLVKIGEAITEAGTALWRADRDEKAATLEALSKPQPMIAKPYIAAGEKDKGQLILEAVAKANRLGVDELVGSDRSRAVNYPRQEVVYLIRKLTEMSYPAIAYLVGGRDHSTIMHAHRAIERRIAKDDLLAQWLKEMEEHLLEELEALR